MVFMFTDIKKKMFFSQQQQPPEAGPGWMDYLSKAVSRSATFLPARMTDVFSQGRAFATAHLPFQGVRSVCCVVR
jgi:autophagy-related protein 18